VAEHQRGAPVLIGHVDVDAEREQGVHVPGLEIAAPVQHLLEVSAHQKLTAHGSTPLAASLRDLRASILNAARTDTQTPCRRYRVVLVTGGAETCESTATAITAAATFQNMSFTNAAGVVVPDFDVPVYVVALGACPAGHSTARHPRRAHRARKH
jgi:hypothetical protein